MSDHRSLFAGIDLASIDEPTILATSDGTVIVVGDETARGDAYLSNYTRTFPAMSMIDATREKFRNEPDTTVYPKLKGSLRNQTCPKCGAKLKRCGHPAAQGEKHE